jgi:hypothetical protein
MSGATGTSPPLDLTGERPSGAEPSIREQAYNPEPAREKVRGAIAIALIALLIGLITVLFICVLAGVVLIADLDKIAATILTPIMGIVGTVLGFYYGTKSG